MKELTTDTKKMKKYSVPPFSTLPIDFIQGFQMIKMICKSHMLVVIQNGFGRGLCDFCSIFFFSFNRFYSNWITKSAQYMVAPLVLPFEANYIVIADSPIEFTSFQLFVIRQIFW